MKKVVLIDSNAIIHRAYHALPKTMSARNGEPTNAVYGFTTALIRLLEDLQPNYIAASFDLAGPTFRHKAFAEYKATRLAADQELYDQIPRVKELLQAMNIPIYEKQGFEADDVIGTITKQISNHLPAGRHGKSQIASSAIAEEVIPNKFQNPYSKQNSSPDKNDKANKLTPNAYNLEVFIVSGDKDIFQLIDGNVKVYNLRRGLTDTQIVDREIIEREYHLQPEDFIDLKALAGDASDNIPGVPGIGPKTATQLLQDFGSLKELYEAIDKIQDTRYPSRLGSQAEADKIQTNSKSQNVIARSGATKQSNKQIATAESGLAMTDKETEKIAEELKLKSRIVKLLIENREQAFLSQKLATIHCDVPIEFNIDDAKWGEYDKDKLRRFFEQLGFRSLLRRFGIIEGEPDGKPSPDRNIKDDQLRLL